MSQIETWLAGGVLITDGGWGTQLQLRGLALGEHPDLWNLSHPERVEEVAAAYIAAGSQIILTNTFGSNRFILARHSVSGNSGNSVAENQLAEINRAGVLISRRAAEKSLSSVKPKVFASIGPSGMLLMTGNVTTEQLFEAFREQSNALAEAAPDALVVETMSDLTEAQIAVRAAKTTGLPVIACMVFDAGKDKDRTMMGNTPEQVVAGLVEAGADVIGSNCGQGIDGFIPLCRRMRAVTSLPLWMKANAGLPQMIDGKTVYQQTPEEFAAKVGELISAGASFVGGCCGTSPEFIAAIAKKIK